MFFPTERVLEASTYDLSQPERLAQAVQQLLGDGPHEDHQIKNLRRFLESLPSDHQETVNRIRDIAQTEQAVIRDLLWWDIGLCSRQHVLGATVARDGRDVFVLFFWKREEKNKPTHALIASAEKNKPTRVLISSTEYGWVPDATAPDKWRYEIEADACETALLCFQKWLTKPLGQHPAAKERP